VLINDIFTALLQGITAKTGPGEDMFGPGGISHSGKTHEDTKLTKYVIIVAFSNGNGQLRKWLS
jgi:hypothetical protein